jgi:hypothetical protein
MTEFARRIIFFSPTTRRAEIPVTLLTGKLVPEFDGTLGSPFTFPTLALI